MSKLLILGNIIRHIANDIANDKSLVVPKRVSFQFLLPNKELVNAKWIDYMCKLGFVSSDKIQDWTQLAVVASVYYGNMNDDGVGIAYKDKNKIVVQKTPDDAKTFWISNPDLRLITNEMMFHVRWKTTGEQNIASTHPFTSEDGKIYLSHNGCIYNYEDVVKKELVKHKFASKVDSEVLLHAYEEWGDDFLKKLGELGVGGYCNLIIFDKRKGKDQVKFYSDSGSLAVYKTDHSLMCMSSDEILGKPNVENKANVMYTVENGKIIEEKDIGELKTHTRNVNYEYSGFNYGKKGFLGNSQTGFDTSDLKGHSMKSLEDGPKKRDCLFCTRKIKKKHEVYYRLGICLTCVAGIEKDGKIEDFGISRCRDCKAVVGLDEEDNFNMTYQVCRECYYKGTYGTEGATEEQVFDKHGIEVLN